MGMHVSWIPVLYNPGGFAQSDLQQIVLTNLDYACLMVPSRRALLSSRCTLDMFPSLSPALPQAFLLGLPSLHGRAIALNLLGQTPRKYIEQF